MARLGVAVVTGVHVLENSARPTARVLLRPDRIEVPVMVLLTSCFAWRTGGETDHRRRRCSNPPLRKSRARGTSSRPWSALVRERTAFFMTGRNAPPRREEPFYGTDAIEKLRQRKGEMFFLDGSRRDLCPEKTFTPVEATKPRPRRERPLRRRARYIRDGTRLIAYRACHDVGRRIGGDSARLE